MVTVMVSVRVRVRVWLQRTLARELRPTTDGSRTEL